ncbi:MAG TPA: T9SS type A sorting domain-containing protein, partial [Sunxiuqinia sp.]|nr:T9SS type A sorting domain-containing protein [Sunxiuqinia sp.]
VIARNQITSDDNNDPYAYYDADNVQTIVDLRSKDSLFLVNGDPIQVFEGDPLPTIYSVQNRGLESLTSMEWKYATASGGPYMSFDPAQTADSLVNASFANAGSYYVVLEGTTSSGTIKSPEVQVNVNSKMVTLNPADDQNILVGYSGGMITATEKETATSREWKWTTTSGSGYQSFDPPVTTTEYTPDFQTEGIFYVVCQSVVNGTTYTSPEVTIKMNPSPNQSIDWTGAFGTDVADVRNWTPMTTPFFQNLNIPASSVENPPVLAKAGNDTIASIAPADSAEFIIRKADTDSLRLTGDPYLMGKIIVEGGVLVNKAFGRCEGNNSGWIVKNNGKIMFESSLIIGTKDGPTGGQLTISDNGYVHIQGDAYSNAIWRFATDTTHSVITISDNGKLEMVGDHSADVADWMAKNQLVAPDGFKIQYSYNAADSLTTVTAKSDVAFDITPLTAQYVGVGQMGAELSTKNDAAITSREWKYATTSGGDYMSFDPAATGATFQPSFDAAGTYYVVCEGSDGTNTVTSDEAIVNVVDVSVSPADDQQVDLGTEGTRLTVTESMTPDSREWKYSNTSGSGYMSFAIPQLSDSYTPLLIAEGTYYIVCESTFGGTAITSNEVKVVVGNGTAVKDLTQESSLQVYPNPSNGNFNIDTKGLNAYALKVFDMTGKVVYERNFNNITGPQQIMLKNKGMYILNITTADKVETTKVIVK